MSYPVDRLSPARHVAAELGRAPSGALPLSALAGSYRHPNVGDLARVKEIEKVNDPTLFLIGQAIADLGTAQVFIDHTNTVRLAPGANAGSLVFNGKPLTPAYDDHTILRDPFNPNTGQLSRGIRSTLSRARDEQYTMAELMESLRTFGWIPELPAYRDERGVILVGSRRLAAVERLRGEGVTVEPVMVTLTIGSGDAADARRLALAVGSNLGSKPFTAQERQHLAEYLYGDRGWSMTKIAEVLKVSAETVSQDLRPVSGDLKRGRVDALGRHNPGRPRKGKPEPYPELTAEIQQLLHQEGTEQRLPVRELMSKHDVTKNVVDRIAFRERRQMEAVEDAQAVPAEIPPPPPSASPAEMALRRRMLEAIQAITGRGDALSLDGVAREMGYPRAFPNHGSTWDTLTAEGLAPPRPRTAGQVTSQAGGHVHRWVCDVCGESFRH